MSDEKNEATTPDEPTKTTESKEIKKPEQKKSHKLRIVLIIITLLVAIPILVAGWFGLVPGLSNLLGAKSARDLGVVWSEADYQSYLEKTGATYKDISEAPTNPDDPNKKIVFADPTTVSNQTFTQEELTAAINSVGWAWMPISNAQVRLSENTIELSGNLELDNIEKFVGFIGGVGYDESSVKTAADWGRRFVNGAPIYLKANASVTNDVLDFALQEVKIGRFSVPSDIASNVVFAGTSNSINNAKNFGAESVNLRAGALQFSGTYPQTIYVLK